MRVWVATWYHRHGHDTFLFASEPSEQNVIDLINQTSEWEPERDEYITINSNPVTVHNVPTWVDATKEL